MAMVMPRARSSGALSIESKLRNSAPPLRPSTLVMAAVSVVLPWSMWPMVPTLTWGLVRSNFCLAMPLLLPAIGRDNQGLVAVAHHRCVCLSPANRRDPVVPLLPVRPGNDLLGDRLGHLVVRAELHRV